METYPSRRATTTRNSFLRNCTASLWNCLPRRRRRRNSSIQSLRKEAITTPAAWCMHRAAGFFVVVIGFMSAIAMLIQKAEKPEGNLVPQHILLVGRGDEAIGNAGNLLADLRTPAYLNCVLMVDGKVGRSFAVFHHMGC